MDNSFHCCHLMINPGGKCDYGSGIACLLPVSGDSLMYEVSFKETQPSNKQIKSGAIKHPSDGNLIVN